MRTHPLATLPCAALESLLRLCVTLDDLRALGAPAAEPCWIPYGVHGRAWLHRACHAGTTPARRLVDLLDLRWPEAVLFVREAEMRTLRGLAVEAAKGDTRPGFLWALSTDPRPCARHLGGTLAATWTARACDAYAEAARKAEPAPPEGARDGRRASER